MNEERFVGIEVGREFLDSIRERDERLGVGDEVVIVAPRPGGRVLLHTKSFYLPGTYRLPTGRLVAGEIPDDAFAREFREELGQEGKIARRLGAIRCRLTLGGESVEVTSYVYLADETQEDPGPRDGGEQITGFIEVPVEDLRVVAEKLRNLPGRWRDWGRFRAVAHDFVADVL